MKNSTLYLVVGALALFAFRKKKQGGIPRKTPDSERIARETAEDAFEAAIEHGESEEAARARATRAYQSFEGTPDPAFLAQIQLWVGEP